MARIASVCVFLAVAIISVVYAASLTAPKENSETVNNRFLELLYTANTSQPCNGNPFSFLSKSSNCTTGAYNYCVWYLLKGMKSYCSSFILG